MLLPLLCTSINTSDHITAALNTLFTEVHDLASQVANLDVSTNPPISLHFKRPSATLPLSSPSHSCLFAPSTHQHRTAPTPPQRGSSYAVPSGNTNAPQEGKQQWRAPVVHPSTTHSCQPIKQTRTFQDLTHQLPPPTTYGNPEGFPNTYPHT